MIFFLLVNNNISIINYMKCNIFHIFIIINNILFIVIIKNYMIEHKNIDITIPVFIS